MIELSEELKARKEKWRELGFLIPNDDATKGREYSFEFLGRSWIAEIRRSNTGFWDDFIANGTVHTHSIALRKVRYLTEEDEVLQANKLFSLSGLLRGLVGILRQGNSNE